jgi:RNA polymerase sigma-70 factor, ECF subfamily
MSSLASTGCVTDDELVAQARAGDSSAFGELVIRHHRAALRAATAALGSPADADDAVQEAWIAARQRLATFRGDAAFRTWLLSIVWNKARDQRRSVVRWVKRLAIVDALEPETARPGLERQRGGLSLCVDRSLVSPEADVLQRELQATVVRLVRALPVRLRDPLLLVGSGDYSYEEVAAMLQQPVGTVKWRVSEARRLLKRKLTHLGF